MLHGIIPIAFFSALLRRFLDHLNDTPEYVAESQAFTYLGTSAIVASAGLGIYRLFNYSKKNSGAEVAVEPLVPLAEEIEQHVQLPNISRRRRRKAGIHKRYRNSRNWLLDHVKRYSKYADHLIHQMLPFNKKAVSSSENPVITFDSISELGNQDDDVVVVETPIDVENKRKSFDEDSDMMEIATDTSVALEDLLKQDYEEQKREDSSMRENEYHATSNRKPLKSTGRRRRSRSTTPIRYLAKKNEDLRLGDEKRTNFRQLQKITRSGRSYDRAD